MINNICFLFLPLPFWEQTLQCYIHNALLSNAILFGVQKTVYVSPIYQLLYFVSLVPVVDQVILQINIYLGAYESTAGVCEEIYNEIIFSTVMNNLYFEI